MKRLVPILVVLLCAWLAFAFRSGRSHEDRFWTDRPAGRALDLPTETEAFTFAVFGDRTGGPADGVTVLADAVAEVNLLGPDLVMTVGDLIQGYNETPRWLVEMREYRSIMARLDCPWFPVAGNHDVYWRGPQGERPAGEHDADYEAWFGPLWYAFRHKDCAFIALYSDEGDPLTGIKDFGAPQAQRMSPEQFAWLDRTLAELSDLRHVFLFLHHPRWLGKNYGDDWQRVHARLRAAGNVRAVFAGHIHRMRYDGARDGIEYFTLATVGGGQSGVVPEAGWLHQYSYVTVRANGIDVVSYPVGSADDPRAITGERADEAARVAGALRPRFPADAPAFAPDGSLAGELTLAFENPGTGTLELLLAPASDDSRWRFSFGERALRLAAGARVEVPLALARTAGAADADMRLPVLAVDAALAFPGGPRFTLPARRTPLPLDPSALAAPALAAGEGVLALDGEGDYVRIEDAELDLPDGSFTLEGWVAAERFRGRQAFLNKTEGAEYGLFLNDGVPEFIVHLNGAYASARAEGLRLEKGRWTHVAGVFDGAELRLYVDGQRVAHAPASGARTRSSVAFLIGADPDSGGGAVDFLQGRVDEVRLSRSARYQGASFATIRRHATDADTALLLHLDGARGPWVFDDSPAGRQPLLQGDAQVQVLP